MNKTEYLFTEMFYRTKMNQIYNLKSKISYSLNKKKRWLDESLKKYDRNQFIHNLTYTTLPDCDYVIEKTELNKDNIKTRKSSYSGTHCLRMTNEKRGKINSEKKKRKNEMKKYIQLNH